MSLNDTWVQSECDRKQLWSGVFRKIAVRKALEMSVGEATESR